MYGYVKEKLHVDHFWEFKGKGNQSKHFFLIRDLSEISRGGGGVGLLNLGLEIRWPIPAMGVKFANPPLELGRKYHDPPPLV